MLNLDSSAPLAPEFALLSRLNELDHQAEKGIITVPWILFGVGLAFLLALLVPAMYSYHVVALTHFHSELYAHIWWFVAPAGMFIFSGTLVGFYNDNEYGYKREQAVLREVKNWDPATVLETCKLSACPSWICQLFLR